MFFNSLYVFSGKKTFSHEPCFFYHKQLIFSNKSFLYFKSFFLFSRTIVICWNGRTKVLGSAKFCKLGCKDVWVLHKGWATFFTCSFDFFFAIHKFDKHLTKWIDLKKVPSPRKQKKEMFSYNFARTSIHVTIFGVLNKVIYLSVKQKMILK